MKNKLLNITLCTLCLTTISVNAKVIKKVVEETYTNTSFDSEEGMKKHMSKMDMENNMNHTTKKKVMILGENDPEMMEIEQKRQMRSTKEDLANYEKSSKTYQTSYQPSDRMIRKALDAAIDSHDELDDDVSFDVSRGMVTLKGTVDNFSEKTAANQIAKNIKGVNKVFDQLRVED